MVCDIIRYVSVSKIYRETSDDIYLMHDIVHICISIVENVVRDKYYDIDKHRCPIMNYVPINN